MFGSDSNINAHTPDLSFRYMGNEWIEALHKNLGLPGEFHNLIINDIATNPNTNIRWDIHEIANVKDSFKDKINIDIEHQSTKLSEDEMKRFWNYKDYSQCNNHYPVLSVVVTPFSEEVQETVFKPTESDILKPLMICIDDESIKKRLNTLRKKVNNKEIIEDSIVLDFSLIAIFVRNNKYKILKELCDLFKRAEQITGKIRDDTALVLYEMIKYHFKNDPDKIKELNNMMSKEEIERARFGVRILYEDEFVKQHKEHQKELKEQDMMYRNQLEQKDKEYADQLEQKDSEIADLKLKLRLNGIN